MCQRTSDTMNKSERVARPGGGVRTITSLEVEQIQNRLNGTSSPGSPARRGRRSITGFIRKGISRCSFKHRDGMLVDDHVVSQSENSLVH